MPARKTDVVARLRLARRYLTEVLINLPIKSDETYVSTLMTLMDHMADHPTEYLELINECRSETKREHLF
jgi:hypothetical protein